MTQRRLLIAAGLACVVLAVGFAGLRGRAPAAQRATGAATHADAMLIVVDAKDRLYIDGVVTHPDELVTRVRRAMERKQAKVVYLKGDKNARYAAILDVMEALHEAHIDVHLI